MINVVIRLFRSSLRFWYIRETIHMFLFSIIHSKKNSNNYDRNQCPVRGSTKTKFILFCTYYDRNDLNL